MHDNFSMQSAASQHSEKFEEKYIEDVRRRVARAFFPPKFAVRTRQAIANFKVDRNGKPAEFRFVRRSRDIGYDEAVRRAINTNDFRPRQKPLVLKAEFKAGKVTVTELSITYIIKKQSNHLYAGFANRLYVTVCAKNR